MWKFTLGILLLAHGLIHLGYLAPAPTTDPKYPFDLSKSWLISSIGLEVPSVRLLGTALGALTIIGFSLTGFAAIGIIVPQTWWYPLTVASAILSLLLLLFFWHPSIIVGVIIDVALLIILVVLQSNPFIPIGS